MHYTIAMLEDVQGNVKVNFAATGNKYLVGLYNTVTREYTHKVFAKHADACKVFQWFTEAIITGCYSYEDRKAQLRA